MAKIIVIGSFAESLIKFRGKLLESMVNNGHQVIACAPDASDVVQNQLRAMGVKYHNLPFDRAGVNPFCDIQSLIAIIRLFKNTAPDIVLAYTIKPVIYGSIGARITNVPFMASMITGLGYAFLDGSFKRKLINILVRLLYRLGLNNNNLVFFQNPDDMRLFEDLGLLNIKSRKILINGSGVDIDYFLPETFPERISFLLIARLLRDKGVVEYVDAAKIIKSKYSSVRFVLVGPIDMNPASISRVELEHWVKNGSVEYLGSLDDVRPAIKDSSVYVLPSYREGTPRTVLEAMAMGRAIITTDAPGCKETVIDGVNGFLVPVKNVPDLVMAMERFISSPALIVDMGKASRQMALDKYDVKKVNRAILNNLNL